MVTPTDLGGYPYRFVNDPPDSLVCKICHHPCRVPYLTGCCGHNFCKSCLDAAKRIATCCPYCRNEEEFTLFNNKLSDREIRSLHVMCTNKERGCEWQGELNDITNHLGSSDGCQFEDVECSKECGKMLQRRYLTSHVETECPRRKIDCQCCHITGQHQFIEGEHKEQCPKLPLPCPNKCEIGSVPREDMEAHRKECPLEMVQCSNKCSQKMLRQYLTNHVENECPLRKVDCQYCHITGEHQFIEGKHKEQCPKLPLPCPNKCEVGSVPREDMKAHRNECPLETIDCRYHNVGCMERMKREDLDKHKHEKMEDHLSMTESKLADATLQLSAAVKQINTLMVLMHHHSAANNALSVLISAANHSVKLRAMAVMVKSGDQVCPVVINITEFSTLKANHAEWYSNSFYTHDKGYKMCLRVDPAGCGNGKGTHLSVFLYLMKGPHDDELTWPLRGKFEVKLLNQISDCENDTKSLTYDDRNKDDIAGRVIDADKAKVGWGYHKFISHEDLHKVTPTCQSLKDDCIFLQVSKL